MDVLQVILFKYADGSCPFEKWLASLKDHATQRIILRRIQRLRLGLLGDTKSLGDGIHELRIDFGPGFRIYFAKIGMKTILLFGGGDKSTQSRDIEKAKNCIIEYRKKHGT